MIRRTAILAACVVGCCFTWGRVQGDEPGSTLLRPGRFGTGGVVSGCGGCEGCRDFVGKGRDGGGPAERWGDGEVVTDEGVGAEPGAIDYGLLAASAGATAGVMSSAPGMIGDFFGGGYTMRIGSAGQCGYVTPPYDLQGNNGNYPGDVIIIVPPNCDLAQGTTLAIAGGDRRFKIADNNSPIPRDRCFFNYHHFHNALLTANGRDASLDRATFGLERTFRDGICSLEFRIPFAAGLDADQTTLPGADNTATEFGNVAFAAKHLIYLGPSVAASVGMGMVVPTAQDSTLSDSRGRHVVTFKNDAVYLQPFLGVVWAPNDRLFTQLFIQTDFDTTGNKVDFVAYQGGAEGVIQDQALLMLDVSVGYWIFHDRSASGCLTGLAPMLELHHTTTLEDTDIVDPSGYGFDVVTNFDNRQDVLNLTAGLRFELWGNSYLTTSGVAPLSEHGNRIFDAEFNVEYVRMY